MKIKIGNYKGTAAYHDFDTAPNKHMVLVGTSGSGKTVESQFLMLELLRKGATVLAINEHGALDDDQIFPPFREEFDWYRSDVFVYKDGIPCPLFTPLSYDDGTFESDTKTADSVTDIICRALNFGVNQRMILRSAVKMVMEEGTYQKVGFKAIGEALQRAGTKPSAELYEKMHGLFDYNIFVEGKEFVKPGKLNVVHVGRLDTSTQEVLAEIILSHIWRKANLGHYKKDNLYLFLDECQNYETKSKGPLSLFLSEGRKFGINLILATQMVLKGTTNSVQQRLSQAGLMLYFKPAANRVSLTAKDISPSQESLWASKLRSLKVGEFVAVGEFVIGDTIVDYPVVLSGRIETESEIETPLYAVNGVSTIPGEQGGGFAYERS